MERTWALPHIDLVLCDRCGKCVEWCPTNAVEMMPEGPSIRRPTDCTFCTTCEQVCPQGAISCSFEIVWGAGGPSA